MALAQPALLPEPAGRQLRGSGMEWLFILGLVAWVGWQSSRIGALTRQIAALERKLAAPAAQPPQTELLLTQLATAAAYEPLLLDTPLPLASNDAEPLLQPTHPALTEPAREPPAPPRQAQARKLERWLAENALAWLCAGAGVAVLYSSVWLYNFAAWPLAAALLLLCALVLVGLSFLHGQSLGALAIAAAMLAPPLTSLAVWPAAAITLYVCAVGAAGFALAILRRWTLAAIATFAGLYFWFAASIAASEIWRALALLSFASVGGVMAALRNRAEEARDWAQTRSLGPGIALCFGSVMVLWAWLAIASAPSDRIIGPALIAMFHVALAAYAVRGRAAGAEVYAVTAATLVVGFMAYVSNRTYFGPLGDEFYATALLAGLAAAVAAFLCRPHRTGRALTALSGAASFAILTALAASTRPHWNEFAAWSAMFVGAGVAFAAAARGAREAGDPTRDLAVDAWAAAGAALLMLAIQSALASPLPVTMYALAALAAAAAFGRLGWRALRYGAPSAAVIALAHALSPQVWELALAGPLALSGTLALLGLCAGLLYLAALQARRRDLGVGDALHTAGALALVIAAFLVVTYLARAEAAPLDTLTVSTLRALTLMVAGAVLMPRAGAQAGLIARWRGHILLAAGLAWALLGHVVTLNPWWGAAPAVVAGPALLNLQALAYAAPAALAFWAARASASRSAVAAQLYASAGVVLLWVWLTLEIRHGFHGANMNAPGFLDLEGFAHALWPLAAVWAGARWAGSAAPNFRRAAWPALVWAALDLWLVFNPWWGLAPAHVGPAGLLVLAAYGLAAWLSLNAHLPGGSLSRPAALLAAAGHVLIAVTLAVRILFHGAALATAPTSNAELWSLSATWALFGAGAFWLGARRGHALLRWCGLTILVADTIYVAFLAFTRLADLARVGALMSLAAVLLSVTWFARTNRRDAAPAPPR